MVFRESKTAVLSGFGRVIGEVCVSMMPEGADKIIRVVFPDDLMEKLSPIHLNQVEM